MRTVTRNPADSGAAAAKKLDAAPREVQPQTQPKEIVHVGHAHARKEDARPETQVATADQVRSGRQRHAHGEHGLRAALQAKLSTPAAARKRNAARTPPAPARLPGGAQKTPGFKVLNAVEQDRLRRYTAGDHPLQAWAGGELRSLVRSQGYRQAGRAGQADQLRDLMGRSPSLVASVLRGSSQPAPMNIEGPKVVASHGFASGEAKAKRYDVRVGERSVPVFMPEPAAPNTHTINEVARGLATLTPGALSQIERVQVNPGANPHDAYWAKVYGEPNFRSYMTAGAAGTIDIYPYGHYASQDGLNNSLVHEVGHIVSQRNWGNSNQDKRWDDYRNAIAADGIAPSQYGRNSPGEDFSEFLTLYNAVRGTSQEKELRALMPNRFRVAEPLLR